MSDVNVGLQKDYDSLLKERDAMWVSLSQDSVDDYLDKLPWSSDATAWEKTLVIGNVRGFASHLRRMATAFDKEAPGV